MRRVFAVALLLMGGICISTAALPGYPYPTVWGTVEEVLDGNRIVVKIVGSSGEDWIPGSSETVRYIGSQAAPNDGRVCGALAAQVNYQMTFGRLVYLEFDETLRDADGTVCAYVYLDGVGYSMVNAMLVAMGIVNINLEETNTRYAILFQELAATAARFGLDCSTTLAPAN